MYYDDYYDTYYATTNPAPFIVIGTILALIATILIFVMVLPEKKRESLNSFFRGIADVFNFKSLLIEKVLKFSYTLLTIFTILMGFFMLFMKQYGQSMALLGLLVIVLGPILIRVVYESFMMFILLLKNVIDINNKMDNKKAIITDSVLENTEVGTENKCPECGTLIDDEDSIFCVSCGYKLK